MRKHIDHLSLLWYLLGVDVVSQIRREMAVRVVQRLLNLPQRLVVLLGPLDALLQLLSPQGRLTKQENTHCQNKMLTCIPALM